jgi:hypothetical protein
MRSEVRIGGILFTLLAGAALLAAGCGRGENKGDQAKDKSGQLAQKYLDSKGAQAKAKEQGKHAGWWCAEHGVPEHLCSLCLSEEEVKIQFKDKGDWCKLHDRAQSQCFKCDPKLYAKYEAMYEAKFGKKPARPPESEFQK